jgi:thiol-disulfide isomerase/thioredoxin
MSGLHLRRPLLAGLLAFGTMMATASAGAAEPAAPAAAPAAAPVQLVTAPQLRAELQKLKGKVVVVNFWATWCTPCLREIPDFLALEREFAARGLKLVGVSMNEPAERDTLVEPFRRKFFPSFTSFLRNEPDMDGLASVFDPAWNEILPTTWLIGRDGKVLRKIQGRKSIEDFRALFEAAL